jgi:hypothetical protein
MTGSIVTIGIKFRTEALHQCTGQLQVWVQHPDIQFTLGAHVQRPPDGPYHRTRCARGTAENPMAPAAVCWAFT